MEIPEYRQPGRVGQGRVSANLRLPRPLFCREPTMSRIVSSERRRSNSSCSSRYSPSTRMRFNEGRTSKKYWLGNSSSSSKMRTNSTTSSSRQLISSLVAGESHSVCFFFAQCAQALGFYKVPDLVEPYFLFKVLWIYHALLMSVLTIWLSSAKLRQCEKTIKKSDEIFAKLKIIRTFAALFERKHIAKSVLERWQSGRLRRS